MCWMRKKKKVHQYQAASEKADTEAPRSGGLLGVSRARIDSRGQLRGLDGIR
jgi:hypothetical protein